MKTIKVHRHQLYKEIWTEPVRTVARRYGISNVALAKTCHKLNGPRSPIGYWARKKHGYTAEQPPLPPLRPGAVVAATISPPRPRISEEMQARLAEAGEAATATVLRALKGTPSSALDETPRLDIQVTPSTVDRALRIMDALIARLEKIGFAVKVAEEGVTQVELLGEKLSIALYETDRKIPHVSGSS